ncbi:hypothetical protein E2C01_086667 [Portunus trituberculatus]|uniref:Uncharacterized protein n=1 Tax=Portunus trituberculatus TaxID=210409 RepID=A0A5B7JF94_PORTR|nr:hypothetical protein [Portunus trituberculatus]
MKEVADGSLDSPRLFVTVTVALVKVMLADCIATGRDNTKNILRLPLAGVWRNEVFVRQGGEVKRDERASEGGRETKGWSICEVKKDEFWEGM